MNVSQWPRKVILALCCSALCSLAAARLEGPARAAQTGGFTPAPASPPPPSSSAPSAPAPYDPELLRLSQIAGALAYLSDLCGKTDGDVWRAKMTRLMQALNESDIRRERMAGAFNKGFRDYQLAYRSCTSNAHDVITRYMAEGASLTRDIASRYGGQ